MSKILRSNPLARNTRRLFPSGVAQRRLVSTAYKLPPSYNEPNV